jgi:glyoxylase I family protein
LKLSPVSEAKGETMTEPTESEQAELEARRAQLREKYLKPVEERNTPGRGIHHAALICSDVEQTIAFYQDLLGFPLVELVENRDYPGSSHFFFDLGNQTLLGFFDFPGLGLDPGTESIGSVQHIAISAPRDRWEEVRARLDEAGVEYAGPDRGIEESMYLKDPDGIQIELLSDPLMYFAGHQLDD